MKNIIFIAIAAFMLFSCSDEFLEINSETELTTGNYFQTEEDMESAVNGIYAALPGIYQRAWMLGEFASDNTYYALNISRGAVENEEQIANHDALRANPNINQKFSSNYDLIVRANQTLLAFDEGNFDASFADPKRGEAHFLRALAYFDLVRYFGEIPMPLVPASSFEDTRQPAVSEAEVLAQIKLDLNEAVSTLPSKTDQQVGRASREAAYTLLADVHIWLEEWAQAEAALNNVIGQAGLALEGDYADVFDPANKNGIESIFEVQYLEGPEGYASNFSYEPNFGWLPVPLSQDQYGEIFGVVNPEPDNNRQQFNIPTQEFLASYEAGDLRADISVDSAQVQTSDNYPSNPPIHPYIAKFIHPHTFWGQAGENWPIYRYAEAKLMMAEALFEQNNGDAAALGHVNDVRARAGLPALGTLTKDAILDERRHELAFEAKRYLDLKRTGRLVSVMSAMGTAIAADPQEYYFPPGTTPPANVLTSITTDYEIPTAEAALNPNIN